MKVMAHWDHLSGRVASSLGRTAFTSRANCLKMRWEAGGALARLVLPAVLARSVTPPLARATVFPSSATSSSSSAIAPIVLEQP